MRVLFFCADFGPDVHHRVHQNQDSPGREAPIGRAVMASLMKRGDFYSIQYYVGRKLRRAVRTRKTAKSAQTDVYYLREAFGPICDELMVRAGFSSSAPAGLLHRLLPPSADTEPFRSSHRPGRRG